MMWTLGEAYNFVCSFLTSGYIGLEMDEFLTHEIALGSKGTPQDTVISSTLFNISIINLSRALNEIPNIHNTIYAGDINIWCPSGWKERETIAPPRSRVLRRRFGARANRGSSTEDGQGCRAACA
ncbi:hypothetical protein HPB50_015537 [Hyalomma asiaticum]|uniref:Uncharacterized protein n=1 Tax=Hyalomma asiaticum TaxID=266040 RepID=A0ACB7SHR0_HYAAI|nr:hypothetical protein HPB50_015537 [Hyalomma asiaticum]